MEKIKRLLFLSAIAVALVMFTSCSEKHKDYIPADSKVLGKIDIKAFFSQTGADKDKLLEDMEEYLGKDVEKIKDMGIDVKAPIYIFGRGKGTDFSFGLVAKVGDKEQIKNWFEDNAEIEIDKEGDGFEYFALGEAGIGLNGDALVVLFSTSDAKKDIKKVMGKEYDGDLGDNKLFDKVKDADSFACLYADLSIISDDIAKMMDRQFPQMKENLEDLRKMIVGIDGTVNEGICDFSYWGESEDSKVQEKIDKSLALLSTIDEKAVNTIPSDALGGFLANVDGPKILDYINTQMKDVELLDQLPAEAKDLFNSAISIVGDINGNIAAYMVAPMDVMVAIESKGDPAKKNAELIKGVTINGAPSLADAAGSYMEDHTTLADESTPADDPVFDEDEDFSYEPSGGSGTLEETGDGYCYDDGSGFKLWFGNKNGALYFTSNETLIPTAFKKADKPMSSEFLSFAKSRRFMYFFSLGKIKDYTAPMGKEIKDVFNAFDQIFSKIDYVSFSMK